MTVTKQQQLEWLARNVHEWPSGAIRISTDMTHVICTYSLSSKAGDWFECQEWQQERDKMQNRKEYEERAVMGNPRVAQAVIDAHNALKDLPHASVIMDAWTKGANEFMDSLTSSKPAQDNSWHERGGFPSVGVVCMAHITSEDKWVETEIVAHRDGYALGWCHAEKCGYHGNEASDFRPLRTEREKAIDAACKAIGGVGEGGLLIIERIYDAGLLK